MQLQDFTMQIKRMLKKIFFKGEKPTDEEIEEKLNDIISVNEDAKLFAIELSYSQ